MVTYICYMVLWLFNMVGCLCYTVLYFCYMVFYIFEMMAFSVEILPHFYERDEDLQNNIVAL
ncbi:hypothetical protein [Aequorivita echinoideorum]|uniref:Uncharacterized protein n=1 Tax=Aequorivita echinoideorum TaxID=1549647 RepID=A0ABS5S7J6_9FLAO|nr:hypothetical protein [Aequorivita echinoideorum]MBT0609182.1 hypothetical protein [Aequorivita echinoideorum]